MVLHNFNVSMRQHFFLCNCAYDDHFIMSLWTEKHVKAYEINEWFEGLLYILHRCMKLEKKVLQVCYSTQFLDIFLEFSVLLFALSWNRVILCWMFSSSSHATSTRRRRDERHGTWDSSQGRGAAEAEDSRDSRYQSQRQSNQLRNTTEPHSSSAVRERSGSLDRGRK